MKRGDQLVMRYGSKGLLELLVIHPGGAGESVIGKRTVESSDELMLHPGVNEITCRAQYTCTWQLTAKGRWH